MSTIQSLHQDLVKYSEAVSKLEDYLSHEKEPHDCDATIAKFRDCVGSTLTDMKEKYSVIESKLEDSTAAATSTKNLIDRLQSFTQKREDYLRQYGFKATKFDTPTYPELSTLKTRDQTSVNKLPGTPMANISNGQNTRLAEDSGEKTYVIAKGANQCAGPDKTGSMLMAKYSVQKLKTSDNRNHDNEISATSELAKSVEYAKKRMQRYTILPNESTAGSFPEEGQTSQAGVKSQHESSGRLKSGESNQTKMLMQRYSIAPQDRNVGNNKTPCISREGIPNIENTKKRMERYTLLPGEAQLITGDEPNEHVSKYAKVNHGGEKKPLLSPVTIPGLESDVKSVEVASTPPMKANLSTKNIQSSSSDHDKESDLADQSVMGDAFVDRIPAPDELMKLEEGNVNELEMTIQLAQFQSGSNMQRSVGKNVDPCFETTYDNLMIHSEALSPPFTPLTKKKPESLIEEKDVDPVEISPIINSNPPMLSMEKPISIPSKPKCDKVLLDPQPLKQTSEGKSDESENVPDNKAPSSSLKSLLAKYGSKYKK